MNQTGEGIFFFLCFSFWAKSMQILDFNDYLEENKGCQFFIKKSLTTKLLQMWYRKAIIYFNQKIEVHNMKNYKKIVYLPFDY
ncbi:hypothetical protein AAHE18_09G056800 [Arachis hypogaea]